MEYDQTCFVLSQELPQGPVTQFGETDNSETVTVLVRFRVNKEKLFIEIVKQNLGSCDGWRNPLDERVVNLISGIIDISFKLSDLTNFPQFQLLLVCRARGRGSRIG